MIEQTELVVTKWEYNPPADPAIANEKTISHLDFDIMKKRNSIKKGIACKFTARFIKGEHTVLTYVGEDSYVIDFADVIDRNELINMIRNSYLKFYEKFEFRKLATSLNTSVVCTLDESLIDFDGLLHLLI